MIFFVISAFVYFIVGTTAMNNYATIFLNNIFKKFTNNEMTTVFLEQKRRPPPSASPAPHIGWNCVYKSPLKYQKIIFFEIKTKNE